VDTEDLISMLVIIMVEIIMVILKLNGTITSWFHVALPVLMIAAVAILGVILIALVGMIFK